MNLKWLTHISLQKSVIYFMILIVIFIIVLALIFWKIMKNQFEQISVKSGFMKHNGGLLFKNISENEYHFKTTIQENHLNSAGITHGGFIAAVIDAGAGTAAHRAANSNSCVTISLELKFISPVKLGDELMGLTKIQKKTKSMIFLTCELKVSNKIVATASGVWKILKLEGAGPGG